MTKRPPRHPHSPEHPLELHELHVPHPGVLPFAIGSFDTLGPLSRASFPHRHGFYEIVLVTGGSGAHVVDLERLPLAPPQLHVVAPGQVHRWDAVELAGWVVIFNEEFLLPHPEDAEALRTLAGRGRPQLHPEHHEWLEALLTAMFDEYRKAEPGFAGILASYLHILVLRALRLHGAESGQVSTGNADRARELADRFARLIASPGARDRSIGALARELGVSAGHLHEAVKQATGRTPGRLVRERQTLEAKRLLLASDLTVAQIAERLGFGDPSYFCRFFRRESGVSPGAFRRTMREIRDQQPIATNPPCTRKG
ncbi:AraC family transcriptional regulator [Kitasatospora sp. RB6PN24]|uniref:helix-turn-helix transcriptional regulator n=1 Tax=Kitasatospora humi TaxID=2893891 RepID=UPI001E307AC6|nr:AraC family transcriptional regulator [Kitasatospora humi]MCC9308350.1 AraC family transcriptional regulator [Kitasatospora humi]